MLNSHDRIASDDRDLRCSRTRSLLLPLAGLLTSGLLLLNGCGSSSTSTSSQPPSPGSSAEPNNCKASKVTSPSSPAPTANYSLPGLRGSVRAGSLPMAGASVQLYAAGTGGNGSAPTPLGTAITADSAGTFSVGSTICPYSNSVLYLVARGGSAGAAVTNSASVMAAILGGCSDVRGGTNVMINEVTTVAAVWGMAPFWASGARLGASATNSSGIQLAASTALNLADIGTGKAPGSTFPANGTPPLAKLNTLANAMNACVSSTQPAANTCTQLFTAAAQGGTIPSNTLDALLNIARSPGANVSGIFSVASTSKVYQPTLGATPPDWTFTATYNGGGLNGPSSLSIDSRGNVWVANYFGVASLFANNGAPLLPSGISGNGLLNSYGGAVDVNDTMWVANEQSAGTINNGLGSLSLLNSAGTATAQYTSGGLNFPIAVAFDTSGVAWVVDYGNSHVSLFDSSGSPLSGTTGYTSASLQFPSAVATDSRCNAYVANQSSKTVTRVLADGSAFTDFVVGQGPTSVAVDSADNVWSANFYGNSVGLVSSSGVVLSGTGFTGGSMNAPRAIAVDGSGNAWVASERGPSIAEFAAASSSSPGALLSPAAGWGSDAGLLEPYALAIDAAGNLWVSNYGNNTLTEFIGVATPVRTPLLGPVRVP